MALVLFDALFVSCDVNTIKYIITTTNTNTNSNSNPTNTNSNTNNTNRQKQFMNFREIRKQLKIEKQ